MKKFAVAAVVVVWGLSASLSARAALHDRGCGLIYDDVLNVTWLRNVTLAAGTPYDDEYVKAKPSLTSYTDGKLTYYSALNWVQSLEYFDCARGVVLSGWRLPTVRPVNGESLNATRAYDGSTDAGYNITSPMHELSYMYYVNLKNKGQYDTNGQLQSGFGLVDDPGDINDESLFVNLKSGLYWSSTIRLENDTNAWDFRMDRGATSAGYLGYVRYVWAVRDGDVDMPQPIDISALTAAPASMLDTGSSQLSVVAVDPVPGPQPLSYQWRIVSNKGTLVNAQSSTPTFIPQDVTSSLWVIVRVEISDGASTVTRFLPLQVNDGGTPPPPNAVPQISAASATPSTIWEGQQSQLSVTATDADGPQPLSYAWQIVSGGGTLSNAAVANPVYTAPADVVGTQTVTLRVTVSDGAGSATRDVAVTVQDTTPPPPGTQILGQDFSVNSFAGWSYVDEGTISAPSKWRIVSGELVQQSNIRDGSATNDLAKLGTYLLYEDGLGWTDYKARFRMRSTDDDGLGLMFRFIDNDNWYRFSWDAQLKQRRLVKKAGGVYTLLAADNVPYVLGQNYQVEVVAQGSQLEVWIDGVRVFLVSDAAHNRGSVAFYTWQNNAAYFDNLVIEDLSGGNFNALPKITATSATPATILDNQMSQLQVTATDTDGPQALGYKWTIVSGGGTLSSATVANPVYTPADVVGTQTVKLKVEVSDGAATVSGNLTLRVDDANPPPLGPLLLASEFADSAAMTGWSRIDEGTLTAPSKWGIVSGWLAQQSNIRDASTANQLPKLGTYLLYGGGTNWTNYRAKFKLRTTDDDTLGVMFRVADTNNYYRFSWNRQLNQRQLVKSVGGVFTLLAADNVPYVMGQTYQVEVIAEGSQLEVWIDGARVFQIGDASLAQGSIAFYSWQNNAAFFDDLQINAIE